jgi:UDP-glucuronate 4-epimerase
LLPMEAGDVASSFADIESARRDLGYAPTVPIAVGLPRFVAWYKSYHGIA